MNVNRYRALRDFIRTADGVVPGKLEITKEGIVHDMAEGGEPGLAPHTTPVTTPGRRSSVACSFRRIYFVARYMLDT
ncbi:hypothetical protein DMA10_09510 [Streptomyces sp. WAC 01420]|nr:hypothetical protein DLM49_12170 [Streptomyces sp. WAC 01438]RSM97945.1 hypothetical protein DMA10_09510 [Streptomyces sp. WAC 01420]